MSRVISVLAAVITVLAASSPARAQSWEVSGFIGSTPSTELDRRAPELDELSISGGFMWGAQAARLFTSRWAAEVLWTEQASALKIETAAGTADLFTMKVQQLQGNAVYHFGAASARLRPFVASLRDVYALLGIRVQHPRNRRSAWPECAAFAGGRGKSSSLK